MSYVYSPLGADPTLSEIVDMFVGEMPERIEQLSKQLASADWDELKRTAHQLKGAAGSYGFDVVTPCAARLEKCVQAQAPEEEIRRAVDELTDLCSRLRAGAPGDVAR